MNSKKHIIAIGQFPPPLNGFSYVTACIVELLGAQHFVVAQDISPGVSAGTFLRHVRRIWRTVRACVRLITDARHQNRICYIGCEGDLGLIYTIMLVAVARVCLYPIILHHHSFGYIDKPSPLMKTLLAVGQKRITHIFLCRKMEDSFCKAYEKNVFTSLILSNAAFVDPAASPRISEKGSNSSLVLGLLSNLNRDKGLYIFLDLLKRASNEKLNIRGVLAGPVPCEEDQMAVKLAKAELRDTLDYRGSVFGREKQRFFADIDIFVFPTLYANEAQPNVLFEAQAAGNAIVSYGRGCISNQVEHDGLVLPIESEFVAPALVWIKVLAANRAGLEQLRQNCWRNYNEKHLQSKEQAARMLG
jgi:glycosyltransferase involved in cell wall biosynthesis